MFGARIYRSSTARVNNRETFRDKLRSPVLCGGCGAGGCIFIKHDKHRR